MAKDYITVERLRELLNYDPDTGILTWRVARCNVAAGAIAGGVNDQGYILLRVDSRPVRAHRVAWAIKTGSYPTCIIDHKNRIRSDNRWDNLREATYSQNQQNRNPQKSKYGNHKGVEQHKCGLWRARIHLRGKKIHLGYFQTHDEAKAARLSAELKYFTHYPVYEPLS